MHGVHVGTRPSKVGQVSFEVGHLGDGLHLAKDAFLASAHDEFALMRTDGAEGTSPETSAMEVDGEFNHVECWDTLSFIFRVRQAGIGQVERYVQFALCHGWIGRIHHHGAVPGVL